jgi:hypothetical protein
LVKKKCDNSQKLGAIQTTETHSYGNNLITKTVVFLFLDKFIQTRNNYVGINNGWKLFKISWFKIRFKKCGMPEVHIHRIRYEKFTGWKFKINRRLTFDREKLIIILFMEKRDTLIDEFDNFLYEARDVVNTNAPFTALRANKKFGISINEEGFYKTGLVADELFTIINEKYEQEIGEA